MTLKPAQPMPKPDLTPRYGCSSSGQRKTRPPRSWRAAGLALLAHPDGLPSETLGDRPADIHRLSCYARRPVPWVRIELVRYESNGTRRVLYHATPELHAALAVPSVYARRMHRRLEGWLAACDGPHHRHAALRLFVMLVLVAGHPTAEAGSPPVATSFARCRLVQSIAYSRTGTVTALGMLRCQPGKTPHYWLTDAARRALGLPSPTPATAPLRTAQPYTNRNAA